MKVNIRKINKCQKNKQTAEGNQTFDQNENKQLKNSSEINEMKNMRHF